MDWVAALQLGQPTAHLLRLKTTERTGAQLNAQSRPSIRHLNNLAAMASSEAFYRPALDPQASKNDVSFRVEEKPTGNQHQKPKTNNRKPPISPSPSLSPL